MLTNSPLDLLGAGDFIRWLAIGIVLTWLFATLAVLVWRVRRRKGRGDKLRTAGKVLGVMLGLPALYLGWEMYAANRERDEYQARYEKAEALFRKRCETAGEFIYKTVPDVKGVVWMKWRPKDLNLSDQFGMNDPFGRDCGGEECIKELLVATEGVELKSKGDPYGDRGYEFVESINPADGQWYRYTLRLYRPFERDPKWLETLVRSELLSQPVAAPSARYGLTWDDVSTREDRENWIAGGSLSVVDTKTKEVLASRVGYMMDKGIGSTAGFRSPWAFAEDNACPPMVDETGRTNHQRKAQRFVLKVLKAEGSEQK